MLHKLLAASDTSRIRSSVISLMTLGTIGHEIERLGVEIHCLNMRRGLPGIPAMIHLRRILRRLRPDLIQGWMYHGNIAASVACMAIRRRPRIAWNIRHTPVDFRTEKMLTSILIRIGARMSRRVDAVVYNSRTSRELHERLGYRVQKGRVIPNGFDLDRFRTDDEARARIRSELKIANDTVAIGMIARYHPAKNHELFFRAAGRLIQRGVNACFVLAGRGLDQNNQSVVSRIQAAGIESRVRLLGERTDIPDIMAGLDIVALSSVSAEAFPNVIGEAMACETPVVATAIGDVAWIVDDTGRVVEPNDEKAFAEALWELAEGGPELRARLGRRARARVTDHFSIAEISATYARLYADLCPNGECGTSVETA